MARYELPRYEVPRCEVPRCEVPRYEVPTRGLHGAKAVAVRRHQRASHIEPQLEVWIRHKPVLREPAGQTQVASSPDMPLSTRASHIQHPGENPSSDASICFTNAVSPRRKSDRMPHSAVQQAAVLSAWHHAPSTLYDMV